MPSFFSFTFANLIVTAMSLPLVPFLLLGRTFSPHSNLHFLYVDPEDSTRVALPARLQDAVTLASDSLKALQVSAALQFCIDSIIVTILTSLTPGLPTPSHIQQWRTWLHNQRINIIFSPYLNLTRWGWVNKEDTPENRVDFTLSILTDLAELTDKTREGYPLTVEYFRFCFVITALHELTHLLTKFAFPNAITPIVPGTILSFGEAGEAFELQMLGGRLVCEWDKEHVTDFKHLRNLYLHRDGMDYPIPISQYLTSIQTKPTSPPSWPKSGTPPPTLYMP
ncbi:hypothetical protein GGX14DRAFT_617079 [Mycena pura]|uniref:Uncharacterized protein n=1 Tax=Mycena pura TaxID=153505 RepID=A0AAD7E544_9AGAR|nr:hypothetical protein GGX14DRAFT_617079 [Mycena pura]